MSTGSVSQWLKKAENSSRLAETDYSAQLTEYAKKRHPGTLDNLFESSEYKIRLNSSPQTLLLYSEPGAGKSVAVACLIQDLFRRFGRGESDDNSIKDDSQTVGSIAYIFFDSLRSEEQSYDNIALCISEQLASSRLPSKRPSIPPWKEEDNDYLQRPTDFAVSRYLKHQIACHTEQSTVFIILEGLDECPEISRVPLLALLAAIQREYGNLNVLLTWRKNWAPACEIGLLFHNTRMLEICPSQQEMELYLSDHLPLELESIHMPNYALSLSKGPHRLINSISYPLRPMMSYALAKRCLPWLTFAKRPLSVLELQDALTVPIEGNTDSSFDDCPIDITAIITSCGGLARWDSINGTLCIRLYDRTIQDYFHRHLSDDEGDIGRACIKYLINRSPDGACRTNKELVERLRSNPFYQYAASHWGQHIQCIKGPPMSDMTIREFLSSKTKWEGALQGEHFTAETRRKGLKEPYEDGRPYYPVRSETIHLAARAGADGIVAALLAQDSRPSFLNSRDYYGQTALSCAAEAGNREILEMLLSHTGLDVDRRDYQGRTLISLAADNGHAFAVSRLLEHRANPNLRDYDGCFPLCLCGLNSSPYEYANHKTIATPLVCALKNGFKDIAEMLAEVDVLGFAIKTGHEDIALRLLAKYGIGSNTDHQEPGAELLVAAAFIGSTELVNTLLEKHKGNPNGPYLGYPPSSDLSHPCSEIDGLTPLIAAAKNSHDSIVQLLLQHKSIQPDVSKEATTALCEAASNGNIGIVNMLLADGRVDVNKQARYKWSPLALAASRAHEAVVEALLAHKETDQTAKTILGGRLSSKFGAASLVELILEDPRVDMGFEDDVAPLALAAESGHVGVVEAFLETAASRAATAIVERLLAVEGVDPNVQDTKGQTPLHMAVACPNSLETVEALLRAEHIRPDLANDQGRTPLSVLCGSPHNVTVEAVNLLLATNSVNPDSRDITGRGLLSWVIYSSDYPWSYKGIATRKQVMQRLLQIQEVDPNAEDSEGLTPLLRAIMGDNGNELVRVLLEREDLDVQQMNRFGLTPLSIATRMGDLGVMSLLRKRGAQDDGRDMHEHVAECENGSSNEPFDMQSLQLRSQASKPANSHAEIQEKRVTILSGSFSSSEYDWNRDKLDEELSRDILLPLNEQKERLIVEAAEDEDLCTRCATIDLNDAFSRRTTDHRGRVITRLGRLDRTWEIGQCPMCRLISAMTSGWREDWKMEMEEQELELALVALSSTGSWLCHNSSTLWAFFTTEWTDTVLLTVVPGTIQDTTDNWEPRLCRPSVLETGFIGRVGSNCENSTSAITVTRVNDRVDYAAARAWVACCRETHSEPCNHQRLARIPHFRVIDCQARRVVLQGEEFDEYVALIGKLDETALSWDRALKRLLKMPWQLRWSLDTGTYGWTGIALSNMATRTATEHGFSASSSGLPGVSDRVPRVPQDWAQIKGHVLTVFPPDPKGQIESSPWMTRGWTYQEGLLFRRRIFFSETEMSFECRNLVAREALRIPPSVERLMSGLDIHLEGGLMKTSWIYGRSSIVSSVAGGTDFSKRLGEFTERKLSYQSDALNAMLGVLQVYATHEPNPIYHVCGVPILNYPLHYNFGFFSATRDDRIDDASVALAGFVGGLCWRLQAPGMRRSGFPSWSWTGWDGQVASEDEHHYRQYEVFDVELSIVEEDGTCVVPWEMYYDQLRTAVRNESRSGFIFSQHHKFDITANTVKVQFDEKYIRSRLIARPTRQLLCIWNG
ncbi:ankyrin repeat-containing protein [Fusarium napiforme]|uniref:Ankyrin repeat-containing protein n=1 Tax=Fusarium napiforme TaxID=42672 RepID=A0A8H5JMX3_9HYPO|nr:ankyrin repeat-containing protein [Fusarium napiforme]